MSSLSMPGDAAEAWSMHWHRLFTRIGASPLLTLLLLFAACDKTEAPARSWREVCVDLDGDGFGFQCGAGDDCNDQDPTQHAECVDCTGGTEPGCACPSEGASESCVAARAVTDAGALACEVGTRTCRSGAWSACEETRSVEVPATRLTLFRAIIDQDAGPRQCDPCHPNCYHVDDPLDPSDASLGTNVISSNGGGITLTSQIVGGDGGVTGDGGALTITDAGCIPGTAPDFDCDGIPDSFDPYPGQAPFASTHETIFMDLAPGKTASSDFDLRFNLNTADIYLYLDMTGSMDGERTNLLNSLTSGNYLPDGGVGVECADRNQNGSSADEESLKNDGIVGNLACIVRDSWLGAGWHRDMPFTQLDTAGFSYGPPDFELFHNEIDLTDDVDALQTALLRFATRGGINRPEGGIMGLHLLATGDELYLGWNRQGNPRRVCPSGRFGAPCWRNDAVPIIIWVTDAPLTNGPPTRENTLGPAGNMEWTSRTVDQPMNWGVSNTRIDTGTSSAYFPVVGNDTFDTAYDVGSVNDSFRTFTGDTSGMSANLTTASAGACTGGTTRSNSLVAWDPNQEGSPDAFFKFHVDTAEPLTISTQGSHLKSSLVIVDAGRRNNTGRTASANNGNSSAAAALDLGTVDFLTSSTLVAGTTSSGSALFTRDNFGTCLTRASSTNDRVAANVVKFQLANDLPGGVRISADGNYGIATSFFAGAPQSPTDTSVSTYVGDVIDSYNLGDLRGRYVRLTNGSTSSLRSDYPASMFTSAGCGSVTTGGKDAAFEFTLSSATRVRIEGTDANTALATSFDHAIGLAQRAYVGHAANTNNYTDATAATIALSEVPSAAAGGSEYTGTLGGSSATYLPSEVGPWSSYTSSSACTNSTSATSPTYQGVYVMDVTSATAGDYTFETGGTSINNWLSLHRTNADSQVNIAPVSPAPNNTGVVQSLGLLKQQSFFVQAASLAGHGSLATDFVNRSMFGCTSAPLANGGYDAIYSFTVDVARTINVAAVGGSTSNSALSPGLPGFNAHVGVFANVITALSRVAGDCSDPSGNGYATANFTATPGNTYYVVVKHQNTSTTSLSGSGAAYGLWIQDVTFTSSFIDCDYGSQITYPTSPRAARLSATLTPGRYYVVIKGATSGAAYKLNVRRTSSSGPALLACNQDGIAARHSVIERDLPAGRYTVFMRAATSGGAGTYQLILRDLGFAPLSLGCTYDSNTAGFIPTSGLVPGPLLARRADGSAIDYYAVVRGAASTGSYRLYLENGGFKPNQCAFDNLVKNTEPINPSTGAYRFTYDLNNGEWTGTLQPGDYYAIVKGENTTDAQWDSEDDDQGRYQLSIGDQINHAGVSDMAQMTWLGPNGDGRGGIREELLAKKIRVVTVDSTRGPTQGSSGTDDPYYSNQQLQTVAQETNALRTDGSPLFFTINNDGSGLGSAIVQGVADVAGSLAMSVTARLSESPDSPAPRHFGFLVEAIDTPGDLCGAPIDTDRDAARTPDTHVDCTPGATPKFRVTFTNPAAPNQVPPNPDPNSGGGYNMKVELIGDGQYVVDAVPVYIVPQQLTVKPGDKQYAATGQYVQDTSSAGCSGTESPVWTGLEWEDNLPALTSILWEVCTADSQAGLNGCTYRTAATVTSGDPCVTSATCPNGYCAASGVCEYTVGPSCSQASDCGEHGLCVAGHCAWTANPIDLKPALSGGAQGNHYVRTRVTLTANPLRSAAPTIETWGVKYTCTPQE